MTNHDKPQSKSFSRMRIPKGSELLARQVREAIMGGDLAEGDMLPSEKELMLQLGLSRATVREGLRLLEAEGFITTRPGRGGGATVQRPGSDEHTRSLATLLQLDGSTLDDLFEAWSVLVPVCGRLAATRITPEQIAGLREHLEKMQAALGDNVAFTALEVRFHTLVARATNNAVLRIYSASLAELTYRQIQHVPFTRSETEMGLAACSAILESIEKGDGNRAAYRIAKHLAAVEAGIVRLARPLDQHLVGAMDSPSRLAELTGSHNW